MPNRGSFFIVALCMLMGSLTPGGRLAAQSFAYLAAGDWRGHVEPCGCDPETDVGGIRRFADLVVKERSIRPKLSVFLLGNISDYEMSAEGLAKARLILQALKKLDTDAILFNEAEKQLWKKHASLRRGLRTLPFVLSQTSGKPEDASIADYRLLPTAMVMGFVSSDIKRETPQLPSLLKRWKSLLKRHGKSRKRIMLFSGSESDLKVIRSSGLFDSILRSSPESLKDWQMPIVKSELGLITNADDGGCEVIQVPIAGRGVVRGGDLVGREAPSLKEVLGLEGGRCKNADSSPLDCSFRPTLAVSRITWLSNKYSNSPLLDKAYAEYQRGTKNLFYQWAKSREKNLKASPYAGSAACQGCHAKAYESWLRSKHSRAFQILVDQNKHQDLACVSCHVLGFHKKGGFVSLEKSPRFAHVNCENCHGPRLSHVQNPIKHKGDASHARGVCVSCHQGEHSPKFEFAAYWNRIKHGHD